MFIFSLVSMAQGAVSVKILLRQMSAILLPIESYMNFMVSYLTFKTFTHFEFVVVIKNTLGTLIIVKNKLKQPLMSLTLPLLVTSHTKKKKAYSLRTTKNASALSLSNSCFSKTVFFK